MGDELSDAAVKRATGKSRKDWFSYIEGAGLGEKSHKEIARHLATEAGLDGWWAQEITVLYERKIGRRVKGQTADGLFQIGVSRTLNNSLPAVWELIVTPGGLGLFIGTEPAAAEPDRTAGTSSGGLEYEMTTFVPKSHFRMRWRPPEWDAPSILQVRLTGKGPDKTAVTVHHEKLPSAKAREEMRDRWRGVLKSLGEMIDGHPQHREHS